ncbi:hypothetical protein E0Z10_g4731 [Xylaria hypoxylon]|uniref:Enoyl reductase (ER) domain-containing protein n=1 Tax=Xylaria hypoxylon TaxID=37992 RepID=A0A4Z0YVS9_9PEZI|nr:hypothetical protein E0Z10_g4731 [Xylaria hypoxylon]
MESRQLPSRQIAIQQGNDGHPLLVTDAAVPALLPGYVLVKTFAVSLNPSDHKILTNFPLSGAFIGTDFSGIVVETADDVKGDTLIKPGTWVSGAAFCFAPEHRLSCAAFSQYVRVRASLLLRIPPPMLSPGGVGLLEAATLGTAIATCILALWSPDALNLPGTPDKPDPSTEAVPVLVYGGSTATGTIAIQLLGLSGYEPITTCSPHNFDLVSRRGASAVFDYSDPDVTEHIKARTGGRLKYALDCISNTASARLCYAAIQRPGGRYVSLERVPEELLAVRRVVRPTFVLAAEAFQEEIKLGHDGYDRPINKAKYELAVQYTEIIQRLLDQGKLTAHPVEILEGGWQGVLKGLEFLAGGGKLSGKKLAAMVDA